MKPLRLEPFTFIAGLVLIFGISPIATYLGQAFTPGDANVAWWIPVAISGGLMLLLSLGLGTALSKGSQVQPTDSGPSASR
jgi:hypothetical protein